MWEVSSSIRNSTVILHSTTKRTIATSLGPQPQLVKCGRARSGCEMTRGNFEVEVLGIYGRRELCTHGSGARPVSDGPYQPVELLMLQTCGGGLCLGHVKIMNSRSALLRAMGCAGRRGWCARCLQGTGKPPRDQSSEQARSRRTDHKSNLLLSIFRERSPT